MKVKVKRYDYTLKRDVAFIDIGQFECPNYTYSDTLYRELLARCNRMNTTFRFYSTSPDEEYDIEVVAVPDDMRYEESKYLTRLNIITYMPSITDEELQAMEERGII